MDFRRGKIIVLKQKSHLEVQEDFSGFSCLRTLVKNNGSLNCCRKERGYHYRPIEQDMQGSASRSGITDATPQALIIVQFNSR
jgi:hypothetical protein